MPAHEHLHPQLFHGSINPNFNPGDLVEPNRKRGSLPSMVFSTNNHNWAGMYGYVYEVEPTDLSALANLGDTENLTPKTEEQVKRQKTRYYPVPHSPEPYHEYESKAPMRIVRRRQDLDYPEGHELDVRPWINRNK